MAARVAAFDWSQTVLGPMENWPSELRIAVDICLSSRFPMFVWWGEHRINIYNDGYVPMLGKRHPRALGRPAQETWNDIWDVVGPQSDAVLQRGEATWNDRVLLVMERKGYSEKTYFTWSYSPIRNATGRIGGMFCAVTEETARVRAEARDALLLALDEAVRPLTDPAEITAACARMLGQHLDVDRCAYADVEADEDTFNLTGDYNRGVKSIVGRYRFTQFGEEVLRLMREDRPFVVHDVDTHEPKLTDLDPYRQTQIQAVICVPLHKAGRFVAAMAVHQKTSRRWTDEEVDLVRHVASRCWESIERARVERTLRESEERFRLVANVVPEIIWATDGDGRAQFFSQQWYSYTGATQHPESAAQVAADFLHPDDAAATMAAFEEARRTGGTFSVEHRIRSATGEYRWFMVRGKPYRDHKTGEIIRWFGASTDIHDRKQTEEALRTAKEQAERASEAKSDFLAALSHELRTPLTPVLLTASLMESHPELPADLRADVATIRQNVELESRLISDLLDLTRISHGKLQLEDREVDLHQVVRSAIDICQREASSKLTLDLGATNHTVRGDSTRLQQIFWNLINNAFKFTPNEGEITVRSRNTDDGRVQVEIVDNGVGIDASVLPRLFNAFEQGDVRASRQQAGLGLGLAISKRLAEAQGGTISVRSEGRGRGATFTVELPWVMPTSHSPQSDQPSPVAASHRALNVLLIEDHEPTIRVMERLLRQTGHRVTPVRSVASARAAANQDSFDLIISDLGLPDGSGLSIMRELRERYAGRAIALTGYGMESDISASRDAGFAEHLTKPVDLPALDAAIRRITNGHSQHRATSVEVTE